MHTRLGHMRMLACTHANYEHANEVSVLEASKLTGGGGGVGVAVGTSALNAEGGGGEKPLEGKGESAEAGVCTPQN